MASVEEARDRVNDYVDGGVDFLKITYMADDGATLLAPDIVEAIIDQAHARGIPAYAHVSRQDHFAMFDSFGVDGFVHPSDGPSSANFGYYDRVAERDLPMSVTTSDPVELLTDSLGITDTLAEPSTTRQSESIAYFREQGGAPVLGTDLPGFSVWSAKSIGLRSLRRLGSDPLGWAGAHEIEMPVKIMWEPVEVRQSPHGGFPGPQTIDAPLQIRRIGAKRRMREEPFRCRKNEIAADKGRLCLKRRDSVRRARAKI